MPRTSKPMLNKSGKSGHTYLVPDLRRNAFSFSPLSMMLCVAVGLSYTAFIMLRYYFFLSNLDAFKLFFLSIALTQTSSALLKESHEKQTSFFCS